MAETLAEAVVKIRADMSTLQGDLAKVKGSVEKTVSGSEKAFGALTSAAKKVGGVLVAAFAVNKIIDFGTATLNAAANFEKAMSDVAAISGATSSEIAAMTALARQQGETTAFTATQSAEALKYLSMAGLDATESMQALPGMLDLAAAGNIDLATAADLATNVLAGMGLGVEELSHVNDVLAFTASHANTNIIELAGALRIAGPVAHALGFSIEEVSATLGSMANAGIKAENAGHGLKQMFARLVAAANGAADEFDGDVEAMGKAQGALAELGVQVQRADGAMRPLNEILADLNAGFNGITDPAQKASTAIDLFGKYTFSTALATIGMAGDMGELVDGLIKAEGTAKRMANIMLDNFQGAMKLSASAVESLLIELGDFFIKSKDGRALVTSFIDTINGMTGALRDNKAQIMAVGEELKMLAIAVTAVATGWALWVGAPTIIAAVTAHITTMGVALNALVGTTAATALGVESMGMVALSVFALWAVAIGGVVLALKELNDMVTTVIDNENLAADAVDRANALHDANIKLTKKRAERALAAGIKMLEGETKAEFQKRLLAAETAQAQVLAEKEAQEKKDKLRREEIERQRAAAEAAAKAEKDAKKRAAEDGSRERLALEKRIQKEIAMAGLEGSDKQLADWQMTLDEMVDAADGNLDLIAQANELYVKRVKALDKARLNSFDQSMLDMVGMSREAFDEMSAMGQQLTIDLAKGIQSAAGSLGSALGDVLTGKITGLDAAKSVVSNVGSTLGGIAGTAIGNALLPGIGGAIGASLGSSLGASLGGLFGGGGNKPSLYELIGVTGADKDPFGAITANIKKFAEYLAGGDLQSAAFNLTQIADTFDRFINGTDFAGGIPDDFLTRFGDLAHLTGQLGDALGGSAEGGALLDLSLQELQSRFDENKPLVEAAAATASQFAADAVRSGHATEEWAQGAMALAVALNVQGQRVADALKTYNDYVVAMAAVDDRTRGLTQATSAMTLANNILANANMFTTEQVQAASAAHERLTAIQEEQKSIAEQLADAHNLTAEEVQALRDRLAALNGEAITIEEGLTGMGEALDGNEGSVTSGADAASVAIDGEHGLNPALKNTEKQAFSTKTMVEKLSEALANIPTDIVINIRANDQTGSGGGGGEPVKHAKGGIVNRPTLFGFGSRKTGIMGEAGPEAIMPLQRDAQGRLGVMSSGSGMTINVAGSLVTEADLIDSIEFALNQRGRLTTA